MKSTKSNLKTWLSLSAGTFLGLIAINLGLPALFLILRVPSFAVGNKDLWILRWKNDASGSGIEFNLVFLLMVAIVVGLVGLLIKVQSKRHR
ncbi:hypothetical protein [Allocoleopsis franciscana]|uniref:Uncharacterized protein n=1 Tax=Allocoleopsis franciscana PCC 7113 TaxID=1173027 RepID=K9WJG0_9CYAN|nr:hypothetical protein [Allocoleopsis franciscana]AFZ20328.1 hypothetical protein Mic7113_4655 [Allocoleopsis franciscana PCC 7113]